MDEESSLRTVLFKLKDLDTKLDRLLNEPRSAPLAPEVLYGKIDGVWDRVKQLDTKLGQIVTMVKEVPSLVAEVRALSNVVKDGRVAIADAVADLRKAAPKPDPGEWILRCVATSTEEDEDDDEYKFFAGRTTFGRGVWTTDWKDAERFPSKEAATQYAPTLIRDNLMPTTPVNCGWKIWTQPVKSNPRSKMEYIDMPARAWTQVYPVAVPASRS